jgi:hypothetical protein
MKEYKAARLLVVLCSYMDMNTHECWPSYEEIKRRSGLRKNDIKCSIDLLVNLGVLNVRKRHMGGEGLSNYYTITEYAYIPHLWEYKLRATLPIAGVCAACARPVRAGEYSGKLNGQNIHFGCGGGVILYTSRKQALRHVGKKPPV